MKKVRIDKLLIERGVVPSRERARALIMAGDVLVNDRPVLKAGTGVDAGSRLRLRRPPHPFASRGGVKLQGALEQFGIDPAGWASADIGASTGGFTDCLLQAGARCVYAIDVDCTQLAWKLHGDRRVVPIEGNARYLDAKRIPERVDLVVIDVSFISLAKILGPARGILKTGGVCLALVKPQFELERGKVGPGGIVRDPDHHAEAVRSVVSAAESLGFVPRGAGRSPIDGKEGNREFFVHLAGS